MILTPSTLNFTRKKDEIPPRGRRPPIYFKIFNIQMRPDIRPKNGHETGSRDPPWPEFGMHLPTISPEVFPCPKVPQIN